MSVQAVKVRALVSKAVGGAKQTHQRAEVEMEFYTKNPDEDIKRVFNKLKAEVDSQLEAQP